MGASTEIVPHGDRRYETFELFKTIWLEFFTCKNHISRVGRIVFILIWTIALWFCALQFYRNDVARTGGIERARVLSSFTQDDPEFIDYIRNNIKDIFAFPNGTEKGTVQISNQKMDKFSPSVMIMNYIYKYLINEGVNKRERFYVEIGTGNGISVSYRLDKIYHWKGLIIETNKEAYKQIITSHRQALTGNFCVSPLRFFTYHQYDDDKEPNECYPLYTILSALRIQTVDFLSIMSFGSEINIMKTLPKNFIAKLIYLDNREWDSPRGTTELTRYMKDRNYFLVHEVKEYEKVIGYIFVYKFMENIEF